MELKNCPEVTAKLKEGLSWEEYVVWLHSHIDTCDYCQSLLDYVKEEETKENDTK